MCQTLGTDAGCAHNECFCEEFHTNLFNMHGFIYTHLIKTLVRHNGVDLYATLGEWKQADFSVRERETSMGNTGRLESAADMVSLSVEAGTDNKNSRLLLKDRMSSHNSKVLSGIFSTPAFHKHSLMGSICLYLILLHGYPWLSSKS